MDALRNDPRLQRGGGEITKSRREFAKRVGIVGWIRGNIRSMSSSWRGERERERERVQRRAGSSRGRSNFGVKEEIRAINLGCTRRRTRGEREERVEYEIRIAIQRSKRNLGRPFKLLPEASNFGNFTIEDLYRGEKKERKQIVWIIPLLSNAFYPTIKHPFDKKRLSRWIR